MENAVVANETDKHGKKNLVSKLTHGRYGEGKHRKRAARSLKAKVKGVAAKVVQDLESPAPKAPRPSSASVAEDEERAAETAAAAAVPRHRVQRKVASIAIKELTAERATNAKHAQEELQREKHLSHTAMQKRLQRRSQQIRAHLQQMDSHGDGMLRWSDLRALLPAHLAAAPVAEQDAVLKAIFAKYDRDSDGLLDFGEAKALLRDVKSTHLLEECTTHLHQVLRRFDSFHADDADADADAEARASFFSMSELQLLLNAANSVTAQEMLGSCEVDGEGQLSRDDLERVLAELRREHEGSKERASGTFEIDQSALPSVVEDAEAEEEEELKELKELKEEKPEEDAADCSSPPAVERVASLAAATASSSALNAALAELSSLGTTLAHVRAEHAESLEQLERDEAIERTAEFSVLQLQFSAERTALAEHYAAEHTAHVGAWESERADLDARTAALGEETSRLSAALTKAKEAKRAAVLKAQRDAAVASQSAERVNSVMSLQRESAKSAKMEKKLKHEIAAKSQKQGAEMRALKERLKTAAAECEVLRTREAAHAAGRLSHKASMSVLEKKCKALQAELKEQLVSSSSSSGSGSGAAEPATADAPDDEHASEAAAEKELMKIDAAQAKLKKKQLALTKEGKTEEVAKVKAQRRKLAARKKRAQAKLATHGGSGSGSSHHHPPPSTKSTSLSKAHHHVDEDDEASALKKRHAELKREGKTAEAAEVAAQYKRLKKQQKQHRLEAAESAAEHERKHGHDNDPELESLRQKLSAMEHELVESKEVIAEMIPALATTDAIHEELEHKAAELKDANSLVEEMEEDFQTLEAAHKAELEGLRSSLSSQIASSIATIDASKSMHARLPLRVGVLEVQSGVVHKRWHRVRIQLESTGNLVKIPLTSTSTSKTPSFKYGGKTPRAVGGRDMGRDDGSELFLSIEDVANVTLELLNPSTLGAGGGGGVGSSMTKMQALATMTPAQRRRSFIFPGRLFPNTPRALTPLQLRLLRGSVLSPIPARASAETINMVKAMESGQVDATSTPQSSSITKSAARIMRRRSFFAGADGVRPLLDLLALHHVDDVFDILLERTDHSENVISKESFIEAFDALFGLHDAAIAAAEEEDEEENDNETTTEAAKEKEKETVKEGDADDDEKALSFNADACRESLSGLYEQLDLDGNGVVDINELVSGLAFITAGSLEEKAHAVFSVFDYDGTGAMSRDELQKYLTSAFTVAFATDATLSERLPHVTPADLARVRVDALYAGGYYYPDIFATVLYYVYISENFPSHF